MTVNRLTIVVGVELWLLWISFNRTTVAYIPLLQMKKCAFREYY